jgi:hypothetical protein
MALESTQPPTETSIMSFSGDKELSPMELQGLWLLRKMYLHVIK